MTFLAILIVYAVIQYGDAGRSLQHDGWFSRWSQWVRDRQLAQEELSLLLQVLAPVVLLGVVLGLLAAISSWLLLLCAVPVLLYSLGRNELSGRVQNYIDAYKRGDNVAATQAAASLGGPVDNADDWSTLNRIMLSTAGYAGFERLFAVVFWFALLGPLGALLYRLLALVCEDDNNSDALRLTAARALWLMEWPAVRVLGLSFALSGNFVSCFHNWRKQVLGYDRSTAEVLEDCIHGALSVDANEVTCADITEKELEALLPLLSRTMVLWLCVLAVFTLIG